MVRVSGVGLKSDSDFLLLGGELGWRRLHALLKARKALFPGCRGALFRVLGLGLRP